MILPSSKRDLKRPPPSRPSSPSERRVPFFSASDGESEELREGTRALVERAVETARMLLREIAVRENSRGAGAKRSGGRRFVCRHLLFQNNSRACRPYRLGANVGQIQPTK